MKKILVTGGCGYIGSHTIVDLLDHGYHVISADNLVNSDESALDGIFEITGKKIKNYNVDLCNLEATEQIFKEHPDIEGIIHFAALKAVGESVEKPILYFKNNINSLINILDCSRRYEVNHFIFSSSCTVYGNAEELPVTEKTPEKPAESPYGRTKQVGEKLIIDSIKNTAIQTISLRYFNPAGAHPSAQIGEAPSNPAQSLVPIITETAIGKRQSMSVHGSDYETRDGSCIRDYIHIMDLANAHTKAISYLLDRKNEKQYDVMNLGIGQGVTVLEAIQAFEKASGLALNYSLGPRRSGDVVAIYADYSYAKKQLGWVPKYGIDAIMASAWAWEKVRTNS